MASFNILIFIVLILLTAWGAKCTFPKTFNFTDVMFMDRNYTQMIKGIAILLIMLGHCSSLWIGGRLMTPCGGIGVSLFLIMSGYGLNESYLKRGLGSFWKKRIGKVYIPYIVAALLLLVIKGEFSKLGG